MLSRIGLIAVSLALWGCESSVPATNPYDSATDPERQAPASLGGRIVLDDPTASRDSVIGEISLVRVGLIDSSGSAVRAPDGSALSAQLEVVDSEEGGSAESAVAATFELVGLKPGVYRLRVDGVGRRYASPGMPEVELRPGLRSHIGDLVFVAIAVEGTGGPGSIDGQVRLEGRAGDARVVQLYRMVGAGPELFTQRPTNAEGHFSFEGLPIGTYALRATLEGFTPDYRMDVRLGETGGATLSHRFTGEQAMVLHPVTAVLIPAVQQTEGVYYTREDSLPLSVLAFGGVTSMRLSTNADFIGDDEELPFVQYSASAAVSLPDEQGPIQVFAQFESRSDSGFVFVSPIFSTTVVRDATPPIIRRAVLPGEAALADGSFFVTARILNVTLDIDAEDQHSAISGIALVQPPDDQEPLVDDLVFDDVTSSGGLVRINRPVPLHPGDGDRHVFVYARDRAGNISEARDVLLRVDTEAPALPLSVSNQESGELRTRVVELAFDETGEDDLPVTMQVGAAPLRSSAAVVPYESTVTLWADQAEHGSVLAFEARLTDAAGNAALVRSDSVNLVLIGTVSGEVSVEGVPTLRGHHGGARVRLFAAGASLADPPLTQTTTENDGSFQLTDVPEAADYRLVVDLEGYGRTEQLIGRLLANQALVLPQMVLRLARGELMGHFQLSDEVENAEAHGGILVRTVLGGLDRTLTLTAITDEDGTWHMMGVPATRLGEHWSVEGIASQNYSKGFGGNVEVAAGALTVVAPDPADPSSPLPVLLNPISGDFDLCAPTGLCVALPYSNLPQLRVRLRNAAGVTHVRMRARDAFSPGDALPTFVPYDPINWPLVDVGGDDGNVTVYVQTMVDGSPGSVLSTTFVRDTVPPEIDSFDIEPAAAAIHQDFTNSGSVRASLHAGVGGDGSIPVAPLGSARLVFAENPPSAVPPGARICAHGISCEVPLPVSGGLTIEGAHDLYGFACDLAGNCSQIPASASIIHDRTPPSAVHGVAVAPSGSGISVAGGTAYTRSSNYFVEIDLGSALDDSGMPVLDLGDEQMPDVLAYRLAVDDPVLQGTTIAVLEGTLSAGGSRVVQGPPLPSLDGVYRVYAQLVDAAGNRTPIEPNPFYFDITLDTTPPAIAFSLNDGAQWTSSEVVELTMAYDPLDPPVRVELTFDGGLFQTVDERVMPLGAGDQTLTLPAGPAPGGDGSHTVHARFHDAAGNTTLRQASIFLDRTPPQALNVLCGTCTLHEGVLYAQSRSQLLDLYASDNSGTVALTHLVVRDSGGNVVHTNSTDYSGSAQVLLADADDLYQISVSFEDLAGNQSAPVTLTVRLDRDPPIGSLILAGGATHTRERNIAVQVNGASADVAFMSVAQTAITCSTAVYRSFESSFLMGLQGSDGDKTVYVCLKDAAGNSDRISASITLDTTPPAVSVTLAGGAERINNRNTTFSATVTESVRWAAAVGPLDCGSAVYSAGLVSDIPSTSIALQPADGLQYVVVCVKDAAGNIASGSDSVYLDTEAPKGTVIINGGAQYTNSTGALLTLLAPSDTVQMSIANASSLNCATASYEAFATSRAWPLTAIDGTRPVTVCFKDSAGNTASATTSIVLDRVSPSIAAATITVTGEAAGSPNDSLTRVTSVMVYPAGFTDATSGIADIRVWNDGQAEPTVWEAYQTAFAWQLTSGDGAKVVNVKVRDAAGNVGGPVSGTITLDQTPPSSGSVFVARSGQTTAATHVSSTSVHLYLAAEGAAQMSFGNSPDLSDGTWQTYSTDARTWNLISFAALGQTCAQFPDGAPRAVYARFRDALHNTSEVTAYQVIYDCSSPPQPTVVLHRSQGSNPSISPAYVREFNVAASIQGIVNSSNMLIAQTDGAACPAAAGMTRVGLSASLMVPYTSDGLKRFCVRLEDEAGNTSTLGEARINVLTNPPPSPVLSPSNAINVNHSCAMVSPNVQPANFWMWELRYPGIDWVPAASFQRDIAGRTAFEFPLLQDTTNILEIRAVDHAGNKGQTALSSISELSSALVPTDLHLKHVCANGRFAILRQKHTVYSIMPEASGRVSVWYLPRIALIDLESAALYEFSGPTGLSSLIADSYTYHEMTDAACNPDDDKVLFSFIHPNSVGHPSLSLGVWRDPINTHDIPYVINRAIGWSANDGLGLAINHIDLVEWTSDINFRAVVSDWRNHIGGQPKSQLIRVIERSGATYTVREHFDDAGAWGYGGGWDKQRVRMLRGVAFYGARVAYLAWAANWNATTESWENGRWELRRTLNATTTPVPGTVFDALSYSADEHGFDIDHSPWGTHVRPAHFRHRELTHPVEAQFYVTTEATAGNTTFRGYSAGYNFPSPNFTNTGFAWALAMERSRGSASWVHPHPLRQDTIIRNNFIATGMNDSSLQQRYLYPIDTSLPSMGVASVDGSGTLIPGAPEIVYHTRGTGHPQGLVIGRRDQLNDPYWLDPASPLPPDDPLVQCYVDSSLRN